MNSLLFCKKTLMIPSRLLIFVLCFGLCLHFYARDAAAIPLSPDVQNRIVSALEMANKGQWEQARERLQNINHPDAARLYQWLYLHRKGDEADFETLSRFISQNPNWPRVARFVFHAENAIPDEMPASKVMQWFQSHEPQTFEGTVRYVDAMLSLGFDERARQYLDGWWRVTLLSPQEQRTIFKDYNRFLSRDANIARFNLSLDRRHYTNGRDITRRLGDGYPALVEARIAIAEGKAGLNNYIARVPASLSNDPGLMYERLHWRRENKRNFDAIELLHNAPPAEHISNLPDWWRERHILARRLIEDGQYDSAYLLVSKHLQTSGFGFAQAEFLSGWLALRYLNKPWEAFKHFETLHYGVKTPISKARGAYWAARASDALGHPDVAAAWYGVAAQYQTTYYGQMALGQVPPQYRPSLTQGQPRRELGRQAALQKEPMAQAAKLLNRAGMKREVTLFLRAMADLYQEPEDYVLVADLALALGQRGTAVSLAKKGLQKGIMMVDEAFPTMLTSMREVDIEWALVHGLIRQESGFDDGAQSHAGARGLMQLMPATAKETARKIGVAHRLEWLTSKPAHNIQLGSGYLKQMLARYDNSYVMALAAYNAGPGRVDRWIKEFGDPRDPDVDAIDWVERIPIYETRNYVQRVLESVYVYRIKFANLQSHIDIPIHVATR